MPNQVIHRQSLIVMEAFSLQIMKTNTTEELNEKIL